MAKLSYTSSEPQGQWQFGKRDTNLLIEWGMKAGPHDKYSHQHQLLQTLITGRRKMLEDTLYQAQQDHEYTSDVIEYPETKEAS